MKHAKLLVESPKMLGHQLADAVMKHAKLLVESPNIKTRFL